MHARIDSLAPLSSIGQERRNYKKKKLKLRSKTNCNIGIDCPGCLFRAGVPTLAPTRTLVYKNKIRINRKLKRGRQKKERTKSAQLLNLEGKKIHIVRLPRFTLFLLLCWRVEYLKLESRVGSRGLFFRFSYYFFILYKLFDYVMELCHKSVICPSNRRSSPGLLQRNRSSAN